VRGFEPSSTEDRNGGESAPANTAGEAPGGAKKQIPRGARDGNRFVESMAWAIFGFELGGSKRGDGPAKGPQPKRGGRGDPGGRAVE
jgi:hypothetical protein